MDTPAQVSKSEMKSFRLFFYHRLQHFTRGKAAGYESQQLKRFGKIVMAMYSSDNRVTTIAVSQAAAL